VQLTPWWRCAWGSTPSPQPYVEVTPSSDRVHVTWDGQSAEPVESLDGVSIPPAPVRSTWLDRIVFGLTGVLLGALVYCVCFGCTPDKPARAPGPVCSPNVYESRCL
jgi:hypothetical protein